MVARKIYIEKSYKNILGRGNINPQTLLLSYRIYCKFCSSFVIRRLS